MIDLTLGVWRSELVYKMLDEPHYAAAAPPAYSSASLVSSSASQSQAPARDPGKAWRGRGRPRKHAPKLALPPLYVFIRNLLHSPGYNPSVVSWVDEDTGCFKVTRYHNFKYVENFNALIGRLKNYVIHFEDIITMVPTRLSESSFGTLVGVDGALKMT